MAFFGIHRTNTILYCRQWQGTVAFYRDLLDLRVNHATDWLVEFELAKNQFISIADAARSSIPSVNGMGITLSWQVADLEEAHRNLQHRGIETGPILLRWDAQVFYFHDPEGHRIELWSPQASKR